MLITDYELKNVILAPYFSKARKLNALDSLGLPSDRRDEVEKEILAGETREEVFARGEEDDKQHWINHYAHLVASDLLTLGKVQPETMFAISLLSQEEFKEIVQLATTTAKRLDKETRDAESELSINSIPKELI